MIDFRYHLVSIIAVFFALAVGIVLGAGPLGERVEEDLPDQLEELRLTNQQYQEQIRRLEAQQEFRSSFVDAVTPELVSNRLDNRQVALIALPGSDGEVVEAMADLLETAGATVTARITVDSSWTDPESEEALDAMAAELASSGTRLPVSGSGYERGAALLASAVVRPPLEKVLTENVPSGVDEGTFEEASQVNQDVLNAMSEAGLAEASGEPEIKAPLAITVAGAPPEPEEGEEDQAAVTLEPLTAVVTAFSDIATGTVAAGPAGAAAEGGLLAVVRNDDELAAEVSTVDSIDLLSGRIAVVYAVAEQADGGSGQYGYQGADDGQVPPVPEVPSPEVPPAGAADGEDASSEDEDDAGDGTESEDDGEQAETDEEGGQ